MKVVALKPGLQRIRSMALILAALTLAMAFSPLLCLPVALLMPLLACPIWRDGRLRWAALASAAAPAVLALFHGCQWPYALGLALPGGLTLAVTHAVRTPAQMAKQRTIAWYVAAYAAALLGALTGAAQALGGSLPEGLANAVAQWVMADEQPGWTLYRLAGLGLLNVPQTGNVSALSLLLDAALIHQMLLSLRLTVSDLVWLYLPLLYVKCSLLGGLFCALRVRKLNASFLVVRQNQTSARAPQTCVAEPPGFGLLALPRALHGLLLAMGAASLVLLGMEAQLSRMLGVLFYATFTETYQILGAAVAVGALSLRSPDKKILYGIGVAAVYVLAPVVLFFIGLLDRAMRFRARFVRHADHHKEE